MNTRNILTAILATLTFACATTNTETTRNYPEDLNCAGSWGLEFDTYGEDYACEPADGKCYANAVRIEAQEFTSNGCGRIAAQAHCTATCLDHNIDDRACQDSCDAQYGVN